MNVSAKYNDSLADAMVKLVKSSEKERRTASSNVFVYRCEISEEKETDF